MGSQGRCSLGTAAPPGTAARQRQQSRPMRLPARLRARLQVGFRWYLPLQLRVQLSEQLHHTRVLFHHTASSHTRACCAIACCFTCGGGFASSRKRVSTSTTCFNINKQRSLGSKHRNPLRQRFGCLHSWPISDLSANAHITGEHSLNST